MCTQNPAIWWDFVCMVLFQNTMMNERKRGIFLCILCGALVLSLGVNVFEYILYKNAVVPPPSSDLSIDADIIIPQIESYIDSISTPYIADEQFLANQYQVPSLGCGPSSYALAKIINKKFFNNRLKIVASYKAGDTYEIVERFGFAQGKTATIDHAWLEIYFKDKFLFIDPTVSQFGKINHMTYEVFTVGDPTISKTLQDKYGIIDIRLSILVQKVINRIPKEQEPYPGSTIEPSVIEYYIDALQDRNDVDAGIEPDDWKGWVATLLDTYGK